MRARKLLQAGLVGGHAAGICCVGVFGVGLGLPGGASAAIFAAVTLLFFTIGQAVQIIVADADPRVVLVASVSSYIGRVSVLGLVLLFALNNMDSLTFIRPVAVVVTVFTVVVGWLGAEFWAYSKLRIPVFDTPQAPGGANG
jgi:fumarate reductase subunit D